MKLKTYRRKTYKALDIAFAVVHNRTDKLSNLQMSIPAIKVMKLRKTSSGKKETVTRVGKLSYTKLLTENYSHPNQQHTCTALVEIEAHEI